MNILRKFIPIKLRNKLFAAFFFFVFIPLLIVSFYLFNEIEKMIQDKISTQVHNDLNYMNRSLEDLTGTVMKTVILLEQDSVIETIFTEPNRYGQLERQSIIEDKLNSINNSLFLNNPQIYITLIDYKENIYSSYQPRVTLEYDDITKQEWFEELREPSSSKYRWVTDDENYVHPDISMSPNLLTLQVKLTNQHYNSYGIARMSIDYPQWFSSLLNNFDYEQDYFILSRAGEVVSKSSSNSNLRADIKERIYSKTREDGYFIDSKSNTMVNYNYLEKLDWYLVNNVNLDQVYSEINTLKMNLFSIMLLITTFFVLSTYVISYQVTKPIGYLQSKMNDFIYKDKKGTIANDKSTGEIQILINSYNQMIHHINFLIDRLKVEERQKQSVRFKMLLAQMNPHFLLNTLNTIKWLAIKHNNNDVTDISVSLGKLLETSLNTESDLITLKQELELVNSYIYIQKYRYQDLFDVNIEYKNEMKDVLVPKLSIQMLVENSIDHGFYQKGSKGTITVHVYALNADYYCIEVMDDGIGIEEAKRLKQHRERTGIGIENIKERLALLFDNKAEFHINVLPKGTIVKMKIPFLYIRGDKDVDSTSSRR